MNRKKTVRTELICKKFEKFGESDPIRVGMKSYFLVSAGIVFALCLSAFVTKNLVTGWNKNIPHTLQVLYAALIGLPSPGPRYIIYPLLAKLKEFGAAGGVIVALISGHVLIEPSTFLLETGFFGWRFSVKRLFIAFIISFSAGMLALLFLGNA